MFIKEEINQKKVLEFVEKFKSIGSLQQFGIIQNDELKLKFAVSPYLESDVKQLFSVSKSVTSIAIGKAIDNGLLNIHDKVIKFFPVPNPSPRLAKMEVFHLITMTTGHDRCVMPLIGASSNPIQAFLELPIQYEPGTTFVYNTGASLILSVIINVLTGMNVEDYIKDVLQDLDIKEYLFEKIDGICLGGVGVHLNIDGLLNFGQMLLHEGVFNGKQVISKEYIKEATSKQVSNDNNGSIDWTQGYGYHIWRGEEGFRCDGAFGQLILVYPDRNMVVVCQACVNNMQDEINLIKELINNLYGDFSVEQLETKINDVYKIEPTLMPDFEELEIELEPNKLNIDSLCVFVDKEKMKLQFKGDNHFEFLAGNGKYLESKFYAVGVKRKLSDIMPSFYEESVVSSYYLYENNKLEIILKNHNTPLYQSIVLEFKEDKCNLYINEKVLSGNVKSIQ